MQTKVDVTAVWLRLKYKCQPYQRLLYSSVGSILSVATCWQQRHDSNTISYKVFLSFSQTGEAWEKVIYTCQICTHLACDRRWGCGVANRQDWTVCLVCWYSCYCPSGHLSPFTGKCGTFVVSLALLLLLLVVGHYLSILLIANDCPPDTHWLVSTAKDVWPAAVALDDGDEVVVVAFPHCWNTVRRVENGPQWHFNCSFSETFLCKCELTQVYTELLSTTTTHNYTDTLTADLAIDRANVRTTLSATDSHSSGDISTHSQWGR